MSEVLLGVEIVLPKGTRVLNSFGELVGWLDPSAIFGKMRSSP